MEALNNELRSTQFQIQTVLRQLEQLKLKAWDLDRRSKTLRWTHDFIKSLESGCSVGLKPASEFTKFIDSPHSDQSGCVEEQAVYDFAEAHHVEKCRVWRQELYRCSKPGWEGPLYVQTLEFSTVDNTWSSVQKIRYIESDQWSSLSDASGWSVKAKRWAKSLAFFAEHTTCLGMEFTQCFHHDLYTVRLEPVEMYTWHQ